MTRRSLQLQLVLLRKYVRVVKQLGRLPSRAATQKLLDDGYSDFLLQGGSASETRLDYAAFLTLVRNRRGEAQRQARNAHALSHGRGGRRNQSERLEIRALIEELEQERQSHMRAVEDLAQLGCSGGDAESEKSSRSVTGATASQLRGGEHSVGAATSLLEPALRTPSSAGSPPATMTAVSGEAVTNEGDAVLMSREKLALMLRLAQETLQKQKQILEEVRAIEQRLELNHDSAERHEEESHSTNRAYPQEPKDMGGANAPPPAPASGWGTNAFEAMRDRAANAKNQLAPQLLNMREKTSKRMEKYQPTIGRVKSSASAAANMGREKMTPALNRVKEGSNQGWSILKTKLVSAAPVAEKIQTMGLNVVTDMWASDSSVKRIVFVDNPARSNCRFLDEYRKAAVSPPRERRLSKLRLMRIASSSSTSSTADASSTSSSVATQCLANRFVLGNILLFCGDVQVLGRMAGVNQSCRAFVASEKRLWRFCVRYGDVPQSIRSRFWEYAASVPAVRASSELDFDTYLHMALSKGEWTELILTDVRRTYGRVAPHKHPPNAKGEVVVDTDQELITQLSEILHALAGRFPDVGYCQGMDYIAAHVLDNVKKSSEAQGAMRAAAVFQLQDPAASDTDTDSESPQLSPGRTNQSAATRTEVETAFWILVSLFENYGLRQMFAPGLHRLQVHCFQLQRAFELALPELAAHFEHEKVVAEMFTVGWFQTLFLYLNVLPRASLDRIWDIFLLENNWKIMLRVAVTILQIAEPSVRDRPIDELMQFLNTFGGESERLLAPAALVEKALAVKVTNSVLTKLQRQHARCKKSTPDRK
ncbi:hypothetical protein PybrP1_001623 [[Pythium] brassicae (nom. inval.)]|nr:hypothetical protein PybrP1_001623 [[Pythium] brassicae (nom. inval.)]